MTSNDWLCIAPHYIIIVSCAIWLTCLFLTPYFLPINTPSWPIIVLSSSPNHPTLTVFLPFTTHVNDSIIPLSTPYHPSSLCSNITLLSLPYHSLLSPYQSITTPLSLPCHPDHSLSLHYQPFIIPCHDPITSHRALAEGELLATNLTRKEVHDLQKWYRVERVRRHRERRRRWEIFSINRIPGTR